MSDALVERLSNERRSAEISGDTLMAALPFWTLPDIKRVQRSLQGLGLLLVDPVAGNETVALLAINQASKGNVTAAKAPRPKAARPAANSGTATPIPANWQPEPAMYQQCAQRNIPREFVERVRTGAAEFWESLGMRRARQTLPMWHLDQPDLRVAVFAHAGTNGVLVCHVLGLEPVPWEWDRMVTMHASVTRLTSMEIGDGHTFALVKLSDVEHLPRDARTGVNV